jgi:non-homologous end joining protein Ku
MAESGVAGIGRLMMSRRERMVMVEPRDTGMMLITLRAADEVRAPQFARIDGAIDAEMLAIARAIIEQRTGKFDPSRFRDRYQEALRELTRSTAWNRLLIRGGWRDVGPISEGTWIGGRRSSGTPTPRWTSGHGGG